jgi:hypothetical protein
MVKKRAMGKGTIELDGRRIPVQAMAGKSPIDPARFIPVIPSGGRAGGPVRLIRRADLLPKTVPAATAAAFKDFGILLVDIFNPTYGSYYPIGGRHMFIFSFSKVSWTRSDMWKMTLAWDKEDAQRFSFHMGTGATGNYMKVQLGMTQGAGYANGAIIGVKVDSSQFTLDLSHRSFQFFDLVLPTAAPHFFEFSLDSEHNPRRESIFEIQQVELYSTLRTFPAEEVLG